jgi:hypothetical protein
VSQAGFDQNLQIRNRLLKAAIDRLSAAGTFDDIVELIRSGARSTVSADGVTFVLRDGDRCHYFEEDAIGPLWKGQRFPLESCISGWSMMNARTVAISDIFLDARIPHDAYRQTFVKSLIMTPVGGQTPVAAMGFYWGEVRIFSRHDIVTAETLAGAVTSAMERTRAAA